MKEYNGHRSWNAWNVSLWICYDEGLYNMAVDAINEARKNCKNKRRAISYATTLLLDYLGEDKTPDGASYNRSSVKHCIEGLMEE